MQITINSIPYEIPEAVYNELNGWREAAISNHAIACRLQARNEWIEDLIREWKLKEETALAKPNRVFRQAAWYAKMKVLGIVSANKQGALALK